MLSPVDNAALNWYDPPHTSYKENENRNLTSNIPVM